MTKRMGFTANQNGRAIALYLGCGPGALAPRLLARWRRIGHRWRPKAFGWLLTLGLGQQSLTAEFDIAPRVYVQHLHAQLLANLSTCQEGGQICERDDRGKSMKERS